jgi:hypothetical protein
VIARRVLIIATNVVADRPRGVPEVVRRQVLAAKEVRVVAPTLTSWLQSWVSDINAATSSADERVRTIVESIQATGQRASRGSVSDEDPLQAIADALAMFPADALILALHSPETQNRRERRVGERACARFKLPVTEMLIDVDGRVVSVTTRHAREDDRHTKSADGVRSFMRFLARSQRSLSRG